jgi:3-oxoacyl-[acyl-carrier protein] reductase
MITLTGMRALVTGGGRGIGAATAQLLAECGADVVVGYQRRRDDAEAVVGAIRGLGRRAAAFGSDLGTREGSESLIDATVRALGGLDAFVANAGIWPPDDVPVSSMTDDQWRGTMAANLDSMFYSTRAALRVMGPGSRVVLVASTAGQRGEAYHADYAASKGAMIAFTKSVAIEVAASNTTVNCIAPGWVDTEMAALPYAGGGRERIARTIPLGRVASARDIAGPIVFLCSSFARHITGEIINVNGGSVLCG